MKTIRVIVVHGRADMTRFLQDADVFEKTKILAKTTQLDAETDDNYPADQLLNKIRETMTQEGQLVAAIFSPGNPQGAFRDPNVTAISDGTKWGMLDDLLKFYSFVGQPSCSE